MGFRATDLLPLSDRIVVGSRISLSAAGRVQPMTARKAQRGDARDPAQQHEQEKRE